MARRIRSLHPEFIDDERLCRCSIGARFLAAAVLVLCDDEGRARGAVEWITAQCWPYGGASTKQVAEWLAELEAIRYLCRYTAEGDTYLAVRNFKRYQRPERPSPSRLPPCPEASPIDHRSITDRSPIDHRAFGDASVPEWSGVDGSGSGSGVGGEAPQGEAPEAPALPPTPLVAYIRSTWPDVRRVPEQQWQDAYPAVDLLAEAKRAAAWEASQPAARRKRDHCTFLARWFARAQEDAARRGVTAQRPRPPPLPPPEDVVLPTLEERAEIQRKATELIASLARGKKAP